MNHDIVTISAAHDSILSLSLFIMIGPALASHLSPSVALVTEGAEVTSLRRSDERTEDNVHGGS